MEEVERKAQFLRQLRELRNELGRLTSSPYPLTKDLVAQWQSRLSALEAFLSTPNDDWLDAPPYNPGRELDYDKAPPDFLAAEEMIWALLGSYFDVRRRALRKHYRHWSRRWQWWNWSKWR